jgi:small subunit ribosomal protein S2
MAYLTMKQLLEAGVHFGHQTKRWNPKMKPYIFGARNGIYIIDLQQTVKRFNEAYDFIRNTTAKGGKVLFVGTKRQAQGPIGDEAGRSGMSFVNQRWIGGLLTNFTTVKGRINRLRALDAQKTEGYPNATKKEGLLLEKSRVKLDKMLGGIRDMESLPDAVFVIDTKKEAIAVKEARTLGIPVIGIVDTNCDPDEVDVVIPGNDDAIRAIKLFASTVATACMEGRATYEASLAGAGDKTGKEGSTGVAVAPGSVEAEMLAAAEAAGTAGGGNA